MFNVIHNSEAKNIIFKVSANEDTLKYDLNEAFDWLHDNKRWFEMIRDIKTTGHDVDAFAMFLMQSHMNNRANMKLEKASMETFKLPFSIELSNNRFKEKFMLNEIYVTVCRVEVTCEDKHTVQPVYLDVVTDVEFTLNSFTWLKRKTISNIITEVIKERFDSNLLQGCNII